MECDGCTLCCKLLSVPSLDKEAGNWCKACSIGSGCNRHNDLPDECKIFSCSYNQMEKVSIDLRPDNCGIIFEKSTDEIFFGTVDPDVGKLGKVAIGQIDAFADQGFSVVLINSKFSKPYIRSSGKYTEEEVWKMFYEKIRKENGSCNL